MNEEQEAQNEMIEQEEMNRLLQQDRGERRLTDADKEKIEAQLNLSEVQNNEVKSSDSVDKEFQDFALKDEQNELDLDGDSPPNNTNSLWCRPNCLVSQDFSEMHPTKYGQVESLIGGGNNSNQPLLFKNMRESEIQAVDRSSVGFQSTVQQQFFQKLSKGGSEDTHSIQKKGAHDSPPGHSPIQEVDEEYLQMSPKFD